MIPTAPMLITVPEMIWSILWRMPIQARRIPTPPATSIADVMPITTAMKSFPVRSRPTLAATEATHAPISILPSRAMFSMPLRSDRMPASAPSVSGTANSRLPAIMPVRFAGLPLRTAARRAATHGQTSSSSHGRHQNGAPRRSCRIAMNQRRHAGDDPQHADRASAGRCSRRPAGRPRTRTSPWCSGSGSRGRRPGARTRTGWRPGCVHPSSLAARRGPRRWPPVRCRSTVVISAPSAGARRRPLLPDRRP